MQIEKLEILGVDVADLDAAIDTFSRLLDIEFVRFDLTEDVEVERFETNGKDDHALSLGPTRIAVDRTGFLELIQTTPPTSTEGSRNVHFKVSDIDAAVTEMRGRGFTVVANMRIGALREAILDATELHGVRVCLIEYDGPSMIDAMQQL